MRATDPNARGPKTQKEEAALVLDEPRHIAHRRSRGDLHPVVGRSRPLDYRALGNWVRACGSSASASASDVVVTFVHGLAIIAIFARAAAEARADQGDQGEGEAAAQATLAARDVVLGTEEGERQLQGLF